jgi:hypothetical protein
MVMLTFGGMTMDIETEREHAETIERLERSEMLVDEAYLRSDRLVRALLYADHPLATPEIKAWIESAILAAQGQG